MTTANPAPPPLAYSVAQLADATSIGRTKIFHEIAKGRLRATHVGGRTIILVDDARAWLANSTADDKLEHQPSPHKQRPPKRKRRL
jgi:hypothetical protein